jgi:hypothetical protein
MPRRSADDRPIVRVLLPLLGIPLKPFGRAGHGGPGAGAKPCIYGPQADTVLVPGMTPVMLGDADQVARLRTAAAAPQAKGQSVPPACL